MSGFFYGINLSDLVRVRRGGGALLEKTLQQCKVFFLPETLWTWFESATAEELKSLTAMSGFFYGINFSDLVRVRRGGGALLEKVFTFL
nr:hypothetical protein [uncultured Flavobacterium sp.]